MNKNNLFHICKVKNFKKIGSIMLFYSMDTNRISFVIWESAIIASQCTFDKLNKKNGLEPT